MSFLDLIPRAPRRTIPPESARRLNHGELVLGNLPPVTVGLGVVVGIGVTTGVGVGVAVAVAEGVGVGVAVAVAEGVGVGVATTHASLVMTFALRLTAPVWASNCPRTAAPESAVIVVRANIRPTKVEFVPSVAELPTLQ